MAPASCAARGGAAAALSIVHVTDVYVLDNFPSLATLLRQKRAASPSSKVVSMLTGDFLAPSLLFQPGPRQGDDGHDHQDAHRLPHLGQPRGRRRPRGVLQAGQGVPRERRRHLDQLQHAGQSHELMALQEPYVIVEVPSPDGAHTRKVGLVAVLSDDPSLYKKFKPPGAFGGARIDCPWETLAKYEKELKAQGCDLVLPLQHLYEFQDVRTCEEFDFPVILSGHDHHRVDKLINGTRLLKPGSDGHYAVILDIIWSGPEDVEPKFSWEMVKVQDYAADPEMVRAMNAASEVLLAMRNTELMPVPKWLRPLSSVNSRGRVTTMGTFICTLVKDALNNDPALHDCEICMIRGGHICGEKDYPDDSYFSYEDLKTVNTDKISVGVVELPGSVIVEGVSSTRGSTSRLFMQYDSSVAEENDVVVALAGEAVQPDRLYQVALSSTTARDVPAFAGYLQAVPGRMPSDDVFVPLDCALMSHFARNMYFKVLASLPRSSSGGADFSELDTDGDGAVSKEELLQAMDRLGLRTSKGEFCLVDWIVKLADLDGDGAVSVDELKHDLEENEQFKASLIERRASQVLRKSITLGTISKAPARGSSRG